MTKRIVFLNALPLNAFPIDEGGEVLLRVAKVGIRGLKDLVGAGVPVECYIRHPSTIEVLNKLFNLNLKPSSELYSYREGDKIIVVTLKKPTRGKEVEVEPKDIEFYIVTLKED